MQNLCQSCAHRPSIRLQPICQSNLQRFTITEVPCQSTLMSMANPPKSDLYANPPTKHQSFTNQSYPLTIPQGPFTNYQMTPQLNKQNWIGSASAQVKPILYQSEDNPARNKGTSALYGQATSLDGGRFHPAAKILRHSTIVDQSMSILYQSISNLVRIHQQSYIDQASANYVPIYCQSNVNPVQI